MLYSYGEVPEMGGVPSTDAIIIENPSIKMDDLGLFWETSIWWFPEIGVTPSHHPFECDFNVIFPYKPSILGYPHDYGHPHGIPPGFPWVARGGREIVKVHGHQSAGDQRWRLGGRV